MKYLRHLIPVLGVLALLVLFLKLPEVSKTFHLSCKTCSSLDLYLPLFGAAYFALLIAFSLFLPSFPNPPMARIGLIWAVLLALVLSYIDFPHFCVLCLLAHACNISIWSMWTAIASTENRFSNASAKKRLYLIMLAPISIVVLFSCLNLILTKHSAMGLQIGDTIPSFSTRTSADQFITCPDFSSNSRLLINFISPDCPYCQEQMKVMETIIPEISSSDCRFIYITPFLSSELAFYSSSIEWVEDKTGNLRDLFKVSGYPTLFVVGTDHKIVQILAGTYEDLRSLVLASLFK